MARHLTIGEMIKTVIFDLGNVIVPFDFTIGYAGIQRLCGHGADEVRRRLRSTDLVTRFESGQVEPEEFVRQFSKLLEMETSYEDFCNVWTSVFLPETLIPDSLVERIHESHRLLLLSNTNDIHFSMIERTYPILRHFDDRVLSYRVGAVKPSARIYQEAIARSGCLPEECFFIDDVPAYVEGARREGIDAVQFQSASQVEEELKARGVL
jgi:FMN phosphatase YigB (HAD superfamily)